jgi:hypothetical protein
MMKAFRNIYLILIMVLPVLSCTERIDLPLDTADTKLVVEGVVMSGYSRPIVYLSETTGYYFNSKPPAVTGATVVINNGSADFVLDEMRPGVYSSIASYYGEPGKTYTLSVKLKSPLNGFTDFKASSEMLPLVPLDSIGLQYYPDFGINGLWEAKCWFMDSPSSDFYRFHLLRNSDAITWKLSNWIISDDRFFNGKYVNGEPFTYLNQTSENEKLKSGDTLDAELYHISREYYYYIQDAQSELRGSDPLFSGPGANIRGNISNGAIGFFEAFPVSKARVIVP